MNVTRIDQRQVKGSLHERVASIIVADMLHKKLKDVMFSPKWSNLDINGIDLMVDNLKFQVKSSEFGADKVIGDDISVLVVPDSGKPYWYHMADELLDYLEEV